MNRHAWVALLAAALSAGSAASGEMVVETWGGAGRHAHPKTMTVSDDGKQVTFDLSALPRGAKALRARLVCFRDAPAFDDDKALADPEVLTGSRKLDLIGPWYDAFAVPTGLVKSGGKIAFSVKAFPGWRKGETFLEIAYEGKPAAGMPAVKNVRAVHAHGQTFVTWEEIEKVLQADRPTWGEVRSALDQLDAKRKVRYRVYAADKAITAKTLAGATLLGEVRPLSGCNVLGRSADQAFVIMRKKMLADADYAKSVSRNSYRIPRSAHDAVAIDRFVIPGGEQKPIANGTGLYVHHPAKAGKGYYAVTVVVNGRENTAAPAAAAGVDEKPGRGKPVFQREMDLKVLFDYAGRRRQFVQWTAPPLSNRPNQYHNWAIFEPYGARRKAPMELHLSGSDMWRRPRWPHRLDTIMISPSDDAFGQGFYYGYPDSAGTLKGLKSGTIHPYTWRRMLAFVEFAVAEFHADRRAVTCSGDRGHSATGALHFAMHHPEVFSLVYTCKGMPNPAALPLKIKRYGRTYGTDAGALQRVIGKVEWGLKNEKGQNVWEFFDLPKELAAHPEVVRPMLSFGGRGGWDFTPVAAMLKVLAETRQPVISEGTWGAVNPPGLKNPGARRPGLTVRNDRPIPVFTAHSGDYQGGRNGGGGQTNYGVWWDDASIVDTPEKFEIVITGRGTVNVTPRRLAKFVIKPGEKIHYKVQALAAYRGRAVKPVAGQVVADKLGLVTITKVLVPTRTKLTLTRSGS